MPKRSARERREVERRLLERRRHPPKVTGVDADKSWREPDPNVTRRATIALSIVLVVIVMIAASGVVLFASPLDQSIGFLVISGFLVATVIYHVRTGHIRGRNNSPGVSRINQPFEFWATLVIHMLIVVVVKWIYVQIVLFPPILGS